MRSVGPLGLGVEAIEQQTNAMLFTDYVLSQTTFLALRVDVSFALIDLLQKPQATGDEIGSIA